MDIISIEEALWQEDLIINNCLHTLVLQEEIHVLIDSNMKCTFHTIYIICHIYQISDVIKYWNQLSTSNAISV